MGNSSNVISMVYISTDKVADMQLDAKDYYQVTIATIIPMAFLNTFIHYNKTVSNVTEINIHWESVIIIQETKQQLW